MKKRVLIFLLILFSMVLIPIIIFPRSTSLEDAQFKLALELYERNNYYDAVSEFKRLLYQIESKKYKDACYYYIGNAYLNLKRYRDAKDNFKIVKSSRYFSRSLYLLGRCEFLIKNYKDSIIIFDDYLRRFPSLSFADNCLYWKGEAFLNLGKKKEAELILNDLLKRYPYGNKADAARFKLRLMALEEKSEQEKKQKEKKEIVEQETKIDCELYILEIKRLKEKEKRYIETLARLTNQIELLKIENSNLKEVGRGTIDEREKQIQEKINTLISWENVLRMKDELLNKKEKALDDEYKRIEKVKNELKGNKIE